MPQETKPWFTSKTILVNLLMAFAVIIGQFVPAVGDFIRNNLAEAAPAWAVINMVLRVISKDKISIG